MKLLESNNVPQSALSGMATNFITSQFIDGVVEGFLDELEMIKVSSSVISVGKGMLFVRGLRIYVDDVENVTINTFPDSTMYYHLIVKLTILESGENKAELISRPVENLKQDNILSEGMGTYEYELALFTLTPSGITDFKSELNYLTLPTNIIEDMRQEIEDLENRTIQVEQDILDANRNNQVVLDTLSGFTVGQVTSNSEIASANAVVDTANRKITLNLNLPRGEQGIPGLSLYYLGDIFASHFVNFSNKYLRSIVLSDEKVLKLKQADKLVVNTTVGIFIVGKYFSKCFGYREVGEGHFLFSAFDLKWQLNESEKRLYIYVEPPMYFNGNPYATFSFDWEQGYDGAVNNLRFIYSTRDLEIGDVSILG